ncbi:ribonuclease III [Patescibacteria group bacterium]|nr:ribonuclease III [Patescibacteria group bacterium]MBU1967103.1 ribonuclease III [Patescibacteria group bacterium]
MLPQFNNNSFLETALTHRSALNESISSSKESNERFEFLGDAVLELATTEFLFGKYPTEPEGILTAYRSALVKTTTLAQVAQELNLGQKLYMSKGEEATGGRSNPSLLADTTEAVIGAIYLDQGYQATKNFLDQHLFNKFDQIKQQKLYQDAKSLLQEIVQAKGHEAPVYKVINEEGPDHDKQFTVRVVVDSKPAGEGRGKSKQVAQQAAAQQALKEFGGT